MIDLPSHFGFDFESILPDPKQVIKGNKYRITILSDILVRLEYHPDSNFEDRPTELVLTRKFAPVVYETEEDIKYLKIKTKYYTITYQKDMPFIGPKVSPDQYLKIELNGTDKFWYFNHPEARNYGASTQFLDELDGKTKYHKGLYSTDGFVSIDDSNSLIFNEDGSLGKRTDKRIDTYVFMYRRDFGACLKDYFTLTGYPPLIPRFALGVWWNKNTAYTSKDIEHLIYKFERNRIPLSVILLGNKWHIQNHNMTNGFSFDETLIKKPKRLCDFLHNRSIRLGVSINPTEGISNKELYYLPYKQASGLGDDKILPFNVFNKNILTSYFDYLIHPLMNLGVDFFWIDYKSDLYNLRALNHYHFNDYKQIKNRRGIVLSRVGGIASHRYPIHYTGEILVSWKNLELLPSFNATASNIGLSWISNDIGGYKGGIEDGELYTRFVQFGCFSPILRLSSDDGNYYKRAPWKWDIETNAVVSEYLRLRHSLIPYLYSEAYRYHLTGLPVVQPLYYRYPEIYDEPTYKNEYYLGSSLLVSPITSKREIVMDRAISKIFLPNGEWYDFTTGKKFIGGKRYTSFYKLEEYPVFAKSGTILPLAILDERNINDTNPPKGMEIQIFPGANNSYELYEDDGISSLYEDKYYIVSAIDYTYQKNNYTVVIRPLSGKSGIIPEKRDYKIKFRNTKEPEEITILKGDERIENFESYTDEFDFIIKLYDVPTLKQLVINIKGNELELDDKKVMNDDINAILSDLPIETRIKEILGNELLEDKEIKEKRINLRKLGKKYKINQRYINLFLKLLEYV